MRLDLNRFLIGKDAIIGRLLINGLPFCYTLEGPTVEIPTGVYPVEITKSARFGIDTPLLDNVPGRSYIRIHPGNTEHDTEGCVLVGSEYDSSDVYHSKDTFGKLLPILRSAIDGHDYITLTVR